MNTPTDAKKPSNKEARQLLKKQIDEFVLQQSGSIQSFHKWMKRLEAAWIGISVVVFLIALYLSITSQTSNPVRIPVAWFIFAATLNLIMVWIGLHALVLRAFPPVIIPGRASKFTKGSEAIWGSVVVIAVGVIMTAFFGLFAYYIATSNMTMIGPLTNAFGVFLGLAILIQLGLVIFKKTK